MENSTVRRSNAFSMVREECLASRRSVGLIDISSFGKYRVAGSHARTALDHLLAGRLPDAGHIRLTPMLSPSGKLMGDLTTLCLTPEEYILSGSGYLQSWHMRWFAANLAAANVTIENVTDHYGGFAVFGPKARAVLEALTADDVSNARFPFMTARRMTVGLAPAIVARLSVTGELGYEIHIPVLHMSTALEELDLLLKRYDGRRVGMYALNSMRLEKSFGIWSREFSRDYSPHAAGLGRFVDYEKPSFVGRDAALRDRDTRPARRLVTLAIEADRADATGYEPIYRADKLVGFVTSGGFGHCVETSLAMGYVDADVQGESEELTVTLLGEARRARLVRQALVDPSGSRMRS
jgi:dimethylglycine dehydrogenase